jgi:hypothetical protein
MDIFKKLLGLYVDIFKNYPLAASVTTLLFVIAYYVWTKINKRQQIKRDAAWKHPAFVLFVGWCILTPWLGLIVSILTVLKDGLTIVAGLYVHIFTTYPEASGIVTVALLGLYVIWKLIIKKWPPDTSGLLSRPGVVLLGAWLVVTPITGLVLKWVGPHPGTSSEIRQSNKQFGGKKELKPNKRLQPLAIPLSLHRHS